MRPETTYGYLIAIRDGAEIRGPVKVGISSNPEKRLRNLQTACPLDLVLIKKFSFPARSIAMMMEDCFHTTQASHRVRGEWFDVAPSAALEIMCLHVRATIYEWPMTDAEKDAAYDLCMGGE